MKKLLALVLALVMSFSVALVPAYAADAQAEETEEVTVDDFFNAIETTVLLIEDTVYHIHNIVGQIMAVVGEECAFCGEIHEIASEGGADDEIIEDEETEAPAEPEDPSEEESSDAADEGVETALYYIQTVLDTILKVVQSFTSAE